MSTLDRRLEVGRHYSRDEIGGMLGGSLQSYLPMKNGRVTCGCFRPDLNPDAPAVVLVGLGPQRVNSAKQAVLQRTRIPIFLKRESLEWEYIGDWRATRFVEGEPKERADLAGTLCMEIA
jgi:hypothetical protein